jgi:excisionase family DNA binding protein
MSTITIDEALRMLADDLARRQRDLDPAAMWHPSPETLRASSLGRDLALIARIADGGNIADRDETFAAIQHVYEFCCAPSPLAGTRYTIPAAFRASPLGQMLKTARARLYGLADLVTVSQAAQMLGVSRQHVYDLIARGELSPIGDTWHQRLSRADVERLRER